MRMRDIIDLVVLGEQEASSAPVVRKSTNLLEPSATPTMPEVPVVRKSANITQRNSLNGAKVIQRDSGKTFEVTERPDHKAVLTNGAMRITLSIDDLVTKLNTPGSAWQSA